MVNYSRLAAVAILAGLTNALPRDYTQAEIAALVPNGDVSMDFKTVSSGRFDGKFVTFVLAPDNDQVFFAAVVDKTDGDRLELTTYSTSNSLIVIDSEGYGRQALALGSPRADAPGIFYMFGRNDTAQGTPVSFDANNFATINPAGDFVVCDATIEGTTGSLQYAKANATLPSSCEKVHLEKTAREGS